MTINFADYQKFRGLTIADLHTEDESRMAVMETANEHKPKIQSWTAIPDELDVESTWLWLIRPPGVWVTFVRYEDELIATNSQIPFSEDKLSSSYVDYAAIYTMLGAHGNALYCRVTPVDYALISVAVYNGMGITTPLMPPGVSEDDATAQQLITDKLVLPPGYKKAVNKDDWPIGLYGPELVCLQSAESLFDANARSKFIREHTSDLGIWVTKVKNGSMYILDVLPNVSLVE